MAIDFPWQMFADAEQRKDQKRQQDLQYIQGMGETLKNLGEQHREAQKKAQWKKTISDLMNNPETPQQFKTLLPIFEQRPELLGQLGPSIFKQQKQGGAGSSMEYDPTTGNWSVPMPPTQQPPMPPPQMPGGGMAGVGGMPAGKATQPPQPPPNSPHIRLDLSTPGGRAEAAILDRQGRGKKKGTLDQEKADASMLNAKARMKMAELAVAREVSKTMNPALAPSTTALGKVAFTNIRSGRNIQTISKGPISWQQAANAISDIAGAYHGGSPFVQEYMDNHYPNINQKIALFKTFVTGKPEKNVPEPIREELLRVSADLLILDNAILRQNAKSQGKLLGGVASPAQIKAGSHATEDFITSSSGEGAQPASGGWSYVGPAQ